MTIIQRAVRVCALLSVAALSLPAGAQTLLDAKLDPASAQPGSPVKLTANFANADSPQCGVRVNWGDGQTQDFKINQAKDVPLVAQHTYAKPGNYTVMVEPKTLGISLKCLGDKQRAQVAVVAPPPPAASAPAAAAAAAAPAAAKGPRCAAPWKLDAKSVNKKTGAYTCTAKAGTAAPSPTPECPGALSYFHNAKRGQSGCRP
ncbi:MAG: hypothetical protein U1E89_08490 [Burkholderiaceae bacterium]